MEKQFDYLFHDTTSRFVIKGNGTKYKFELRCASDDALRVFMCVNGVKEQMECARRAPAPKVNPDVKYAYYNVTLELTKKLISYYFIIEKGESTIYYDALGASWEHDDVGNFEYTPGFKTPNWAKGAVMYQIMVDRFHNGDFTNDVVGEEYAYLGTTVGHIDDWHQPPAVDGTREFYGGDLRGVMEKLDYLKDLGVEVIYFNPLFVSPSNHKYDTQDYDYIDPHFGEIVDDGGERLKQGEYSNENAEMYKIRTTDIRNLEASNKLFIQLVRRAHTLGIKVIIDGVFNHCGSFNKWMDKEKIYADNKDYKPGAYESKLSPYVDYFKFYEDDWPDNYHYEGWWNHDTLPKLNYEDSPRLQKYILNIAKKWVSPPYNADGWRLDVAADLGHSEEFNHEFWKKYRRAVKNANPNALILAEHYGDAHAWLGGDQWDTVMNYDAFMDPVSWFLTGVDKHSDHSKPELRGDAKEFKRAVDKQLSRMQSQSIVVAMNELSNHDHSRFLTRTNMKTGRVATEGSDAAGEGLNYGIFRQGVAMQMTMPGAPTVYYGDEAGVVGWTDPDNRRTYPWGKEDKDLIKFYKKAISIHKENPCLKTGSFMILIAEQDMLAYGRFNRDTAIVTAVNTSDHDIEFDIPVWKMGVDAKKYERLLYTTEEGYESAKVDSGSSKGILHVKLGKCSSGIYRTKY